MNTHCNYCTKNIIPYDWYSIAPAYGQQHNYYCNTRCMRDYVRAMAYITQYQQQFARKLY